MSEHTPTPWKLAGDPDNMIVCDEEGGSIADCAPPGPWMRETTALENAAFIVKAVNAHEALVKALSDIWKIVHTPSHATSHRRAQDHFMADFDQIRKVIKESGADVGSPATPPK